MHNILGFSPAIVASSIMVVCYILLFSEKINRAIVAILGGAMMIFTGILTQETAIDGIDFNTLALLIGMMTIVGISEKSGMFQFVAVWGAQKVRANPRGLLIVMALVTAFFSAFLDNVTTVLLIVPVTFQITRKLKINPYPYLLMEIFASNIGGTSTLIGDPPNIMLGSALGLSFMDFVKNLAPLVIVVMLFLVLAFDLIWGKNLKTTKEDKESVMAISAIDCITDFRLLFKCLVVLFMVITAFIMAEHLGVANGTIALAGGGLLLLLYTLGSSHEERDRKVEEVFSVIDWTTIFFFAGLFVIVFGLEETGLLQILGQKFMSLTEGSIEKTMYLILWVSAIVSSAIDNIPFVATMIPLVKSMEPSMGGREAMMPVWWALSLGACFGGNGTLIGASANVIVAGMAAREGRGISFMGFMLWSVPVMLLSILVSTVYLSLVF